MTIHLPNDFYACECGNTWLYDDGGNQVAWFDLPGTNQRLEIAITPANYPGFELTVLSPELSTDESLAEHILTTCQGWYVRKCNINGVTPLPPHGLIPSKDTKETNNG